MAGNSKSIDTLVDPAAIKQIVDLKAESAGLRSEMVALLETAIKLNATLGGSTAATFSKNAKASTDATEKLIANTNKQIELENKKAQAQEKAVNQYLVLLSRQQAERDKADAKEISAAEKKVAKLQAIADKAAAEQARKAAVQFPAGQASNNPVTQEPDVASVRYEPIITGEENMQIAVNNTTEAVNAQGLSMDELSVSYRANIELLLALKVEQAEANASLKALTVTGAASGEQQVLLTAEQLRLKTAIQQTNLTLSQQTKQMLAQDTSAAQNQARLDELRVAYNNLSLAEKENIEIGGVWLAEIEKLDIALKENSVDQGIYNKNVGNYPAITGLATRASEQFTRQLIRMGVQFLLIGVIFGAITWLYDLIKNLDIFTGRLNQAYQNLQALNEVMKQADSIAGDNIAILKILYSTTTDVNESEATRIEAAETLKRLYPDLLKNSSDMAIMNGEEADSINKITQAILDEAKADAALTKIRAIEAKRLDNEFQREKERNANMAQLKRVGTPGDTNAFNGTRNANSDALTPGLSQSQREQVERQSILTQEKIQQQQAAQDDKVLAAQEDFLVKFAGKGNLLNVIDKGAKDKKQPKVKDTDNTELLEYYRLQLEETQKNAKAILDNDTQSFEARRVALGQYIKSSEGLVKNAEATALADKNIDHQKRLNIELEFQNKMKDVQNSAANETEKLQKSVSEKLRDDLENLIKYNEDAEKLSIQKLAEIRDGQLDVIQSQTEKEIDILNKKREKGLIDEKQYQHQLTLIQDQANIDRLSQEALYLQGVLEVRQAAENAAIANLQGQGGQAAIDKVKANSGVASATAAVNKVGGQLTGAVNKLGQDSGNTDTDDQRRQKAQLAILDASKKGIDEVQSLQDKLYESQISKLEKIGKLIDENATLDKAAVERGMDTQANKARRMADIDAQAASAQKANQENIAKLKTKEAKADKLASEAKIIASTAEAAIKAPAELGPILGLLAVPVVLALGAAQLAIAAAAPIPQFAKGGTHKGGLLIYGEKGSEHVQLPDGREFYSPSVPTIAKLPAGTKITPHGMLPETPRWTSTRSDNSDVVQAVRENTQAVKGIKQSRNSRIAGWMQETRKANEWGDYERGRFK